MYDFIINDQLMKRRKQLCGSRIDSHVITQFGEQKKAYREPEGYYCLFDGFHEV